MFKFWERKKEDVARALIVYKDDMCASYVKTCNMKDNAHCYNCKKEIGKGQGAYLFYTYFEPIGVTIPTYACVECGKKLIIDGVMFNI